MPFESMGKMEDHFGEEMITFTLESANVQRSISYLYQNQSKMTKVKQTYLIFYSPLVCWTPFALKYYLQLSFTLYSNHDLNESRMNYHCLLIATHTQLLKELIVLSEWERSIHCDYRYYSEHFIHVCLAYFQQCILMEFW